MPPLWGEPPSPSPPCRVLSAQVKPDGSLTAPHASLGDPHHPQPCLPSSARVPVLLGLGREGTAHRCPGSLGRVTTEQPVAPRCADPPASPSVLSRPWSTRCRLGPRATLISACGALASGRTSSGWSFPPGPGAPAAPASVPCGAWSAGLLGAPGGVTERMLSQPRPRTSARSGCIQDVPAHSVRGPPAPCVLAVLTVTLVQGDSRTR